jgi:drug/metabolite transporter (DMT)-like permease
LPALARHPLPTTARLVARLRPPAGRASTATASRRTAIAALVLATAIWGGSFVVIKSGVRAVPVAHFLALRFFLSALLLAPLATRSGQLRPALRHRGPWILGLLLFAGVALQAGGLQTTSPAHSAFLTSLAVLVVPFLVWATTRRPPPRRSWFAAVLATLGLALIFSGSTDHLQAGDVLSLLCAVAFGLYVVVAAAVAPGVPVLGAVAVQSLVCLALCLPWLAFETGPLLPPLPSGVFWSAVYAGVGATAVAFGLQLFAQRRLGSVQTAILLCLEPVIATATSLLLGDDRLTVSLVLGGCLLLVTAVSVEALPDT